MLPALDKTSALMHKVHQNGAAIFLRRGSLLTLEKMIVPFCKVYQSKKNSSKLFIFSGSDLLVKNLLGATSFYIDTKVLKSDLYGKSRNLLIKEFSRHNMSSCRDGGARKWFLRGRSKSSGQGIFSAKHVFT
ncbi:hypothetical protein FF1_035734 [Malus domestica]